MTPARALAEWTTQLGDALGIDLDVAIDDILDLARDVADQIHRPAAPLTTFIVGYADAMRGGSIADTPTASTSRPNANAQAE